jgi:hypothetical protein
MERLSPYELELLSSSPTTQGAPNPTPPPPLSPISRQHQHDGDGGGDATHQVERARDHYGEDLYDDDDDDDLLLEGGKSSNHTTAAANNFQGGDEHFETDRLLGQDEGREDDNSSSREVTTSCSSSFDDFGGGEVGTRLAELARKAAKKKSSKRVSWVDLEKGSDSVVFGAVTAVFAAPSREEYDRSPGHRLRRSRPLQRRQKVMLTIFILIFLLIISGLLALVIALLTGHLRRGS